MSPTVSPLIAAQEHAANADDNVSRGLLIPAQQEHAKAAEAYQVCVDASNDESTKTTLRRLHNHHKKMAADLSARIAQLRADGVDPALPQKPALPRNPSAAGPTGGLAPGPSASPPPHVAHARLGDSQFTVDESFMLLGHQSATADAGDAFNHFWKAMERLDHLAKPVAFATASLGLGAAFDAATGRNSASDSATGRRSAHSSDMEDSADQLLPRRSPGASDRTSAKQSVIDLRSDFDEIAEEDYDSSDSFCFVPSKAEPAPAVLAQENAALRAQAERLARDLERAQRTLQIRGEQDQQLRDSIAVARREAQRAMGASLVLSRPGAPFDLNTLGSLQVPSPARPPLPPSPAVARTPVPPSPVVARAPPPPPQLDRRVRELEDELRTAREELRQVRVENEKQKAMIAKFRERWDKLKESAKRKREAKAAAEAVHERIDEEPEAEARAEAEAEAGGKAEAVREAQVLTGA